MLRYAQHDGVVTSATAHCCHPERSEGSRCPASQTFHGVNTEWNEWAQGDNPG